MSWWVHILRCGDGTLYTGTAADVERHLTAYRRGRGVKYTRGRGPLAVIYREACPDRGTALRQETATKKYRRAKKEALTSDYAERRSRMKKTAFIGTGNMDTPLIQAACRAVRMEQVVIADHTRTKAEALAAELGCAVAQDNRAAAAQTGYIVLCVKPQMMGEVLSELAPALGERQTVVPIAANLTCGTLQGWLAGAQGRPTLLRIIPNTPAAIRKGMLALCAKTGTAEECLTGVEDLLAPAGQVKHTTEGRMDAFSAAAGCGPAFVYPLIEALADGSVKVGLPRGQTVTYAAQMMLGAAAMVLGSGKHPGQLKDEVCSPSGSTIAGVAALEKQGFRSAAIQAVEAAFRHNQELGKV